MIKKTVIRQVDRREILLIPREDLISMGAKPADPDLVKSFAGVGGDIINAMETQIGELRFDLSKVQVFVVGGSMESFYSYATLLGGDHLTASQFSFLPLSRQTIPTEFYNNEHVRPDYDQFVRRTIRPYLEQGKTIVLLDTIFIGRTLATLYRTVADLSKEMRLSSNVIPIGILEEKGNSDDKTDYLVHRLKNFNIQEWPPKVSAESFRQWSDRIPLIILKTSIDNRQVYQTLVNARLPKKWFWGKYKKYNDQGNPIPDSKPSRAERLNTLLFFQDLERVGRCAKLLSR